MCTRNVRWNFPSFNSLIFRFGRNLSAGSTRFTSSDSENSILIYMPSIYFAAAVIHYNVTMLTEGFIFFSFCDKQDLLNVRNFTSWMLSSRHNEQNVHKTKAPPNFQIYSCLSIGSSAFSSSKHTYPDCYCHCTLDCLCYDWQAFCTLLNSFVVLLMLIDFFCLPLCQHYWAAACLIQN